MESFREMSKEELQAQEVEVNKKYQEFKDLHLSLNMARGKPAPNQIDHANGMLETMTDYHAKDGLDVRNYGVLDGLPEMKEIFSDLLDIPAKNIIVGGNASLNLMFDQMMRLVVFGTAGEKPWGGVYKEAIPLVDVMYITEININIEQGDVFFPEFDENDFDITIEEMSEDNEQFTRKIYRRKVAVKNRNFKEQRYEYYCTAVSS